MKSLLLAIASLIVLVYAAWSAQAHLTNLRALATPAETATTNATVTSVQHPQLREGETGEHLRARVEISYNINGKKYGRIFLLPLGDINLKQGDALSVTYLKRAPEFVLTEGEIAKLPEHISGMQTLSMVLGLAALIVPFGVAGFGRKRQKKKAAQQKASAA